MQPHFIHLRMHTEYSLKDGLLTIPNIMNKLIIFGMPAIAITDRNNLFATMKFYKAALEAGIKPIIGVDVCVAKSATSKQAYRLTLLCQNNEGYRNLVKLISRSYVEGQKTNHPVIQKSWLATYSPGLIALSGAKEGDIGVALLSQNNTQAKECLQYWQTIFPSRFYIEISRVGKPQEESYIHLALQLSETTHAPLVATNDVRFLDREDFEAHEARVCIQEGLALNDARRTHNYTDQQYLRNQEDMQRLFADIPEALANTIEIAKRCNVSFTLGQNRLPHFSVPETYTAESYLSEIAHAGLKERLQKRFDTQAEIFSHQRRPYDLRLSQELDVINKMGFAGYFLIVADFIKWAKENGIPVGPGRGSGPGSLVAYTLKITDLDPLFHDLLFERFLNPERISMPDFDIDFCIEGRDRVIEYVMEKHGHESVAQIITYGTMAAKAVVRDVGRVLGLGYGFVDKIAKLIPFELGMTLEKAIAQEPLLRERYEHEEEVRTLIDLARKLEGIVRNVGKHAGGIVITPGKLTDFVPLYCEPNDAAHVITQFDKDDVEAVGLVKFDFLGLKTLTIIEYALRVINKQREQEHQPPIDINLIPLHDPLTFKLLKECQSTAIFQLESHGMRDLIKRLQPDCFEDLIALVALFRPGPLQAGAADDFINRKHGRAKIVYQHPLLTPILRPTYGAIVYQEQVMQIAQVLAGYTLGSADLLRKAMGKKQPDEMAKQREIFCRGAMEYKVNAEVASHIFDLMEKFAGYGFNKSHSASYALIAYQTAWLKAHYPAAFMSAVLSADMDKIDKIMILLDECQSLKLHVSPPDINKSEYKFKVIDEKHIMYGLGAIKGVGLAAIENMMSVRERDGNFKNLFDFCHRVDLRKANRRVLEVLIKSGCFDSFNQQRSILFTSIDLALQQAEQTLHNQLHGQHDFLGMQIATDLTEYQDTPAWSEEARLRGEKETLGFYLSGHPLNRYLNELAHFTTCQLISLNIKQHHTARIAGIITHVRTRQTKKGDRLAILNIDDGSAQMEAICFPECFHKHRKLINPDQLIIIDGEVGLDEFNNHIRLISRELYTIEQARERFVKYLQISLQDTHTFDPHQFEQLITQHLGGHCPIVIGYRHDHIQTNIKLGKNWLVKPTDDLLTIIIEQLPIENVKYVY